MGGEYDGDNHLKPLDADKMMRAWKEAGNRIQWRR